MGHVGCMDAMGCVRVGCVDMSRWIGKSIEWDISNFVFQSWTFNKFIHLVIVSKCPGVTRVNLHLFISVIIIIVNINYCTISRRAKFINPCARVFDLQVFEMLVFWPPGIWVKSQPDSHLLTSVSSENSCGHLFSNTVTHSGLIMSIL
jgi:hypothetical protein